MSIFKMTCRACGGSGRQESSGFDIGATLIGGAGGTCFRCNGARAVDVEGRYMEMPIGRATVVLCHADGYLLCVQRSHEDTRKLRLNRKWWKRSEQFLRNALMPTIEVSAHV